jgi:hypothetical protein
MKVEQSPNLTEKASSGIMHVLRRMGPGRFVFTPPTTTAYSYLWAKRPRQADLRPAIRLSNGGKLVEGVLRF